MPLLSSLLAPWLAILAFFLWKRYRKSVGPYRQLPLPPGPKPWPLIGNALDVPSTFPWKTYAQWRQKYGDIVHIRVLRQPMIILNSMKAVTDLMEKRSSNYSDRLQTEMVLLMGADWNMSIKKYGQEWRQHRRALHQYFNQTAVQEYRPRLREGARDLLRRLHREPDGFIHHIRYAFGTNMLSIMYGIQAAMKDDHYITITERALMATSEAFTPGAFWVDFMPILKYVPSWFPGAGFKHTAARWLVDQKAVREEPWHNIVIASQKDSSSVSVQILERISHLDGAAYAEEEEIAKCITAAAYEGGADTTVSTVTSFFLAMVRYPEVQRRAQEELARVVGPERLPDFSDRVSLPYIDALCRESMRWQPVTPLGLPHRSLDDDEYRGYLIPGGALVMHNTWAILHDPEAYPDPEEFRPERFMKDGKLDPAVMDPAAIAFGAGRRICPGKHFSSLSLFINLACILYTFDVTPVLDAQGNPIIPEPHMGSGGLSHPRPFRCTIRPRSKLAEALILE
ncbi:CyP450 monooxygenase [Obba rivulosa]|uniref:CyP450 monooxygenase n=1 Tax=Obba rivulosa TaxID=1052685 RepID=A0A8E2AX93_9APHY|nr:CyP450 monooxygenase [Obba rivulosa]